MSLKVYVEGKRVVGPPSLLKSIGSGFGSVNVTATEVTNSIMIGRTKRIEVRGRTLNGIPFDELEYAENAEVKPPVWKKIAQFFLPQWGKLR